MCSFNGILRSSKLPRSVEKDVYLNTRNTTDRCVKRLNLNATLERNISCAEKERERESELN